MSKARTITRRLRARHRNAARVIAARKQARAQWLRARHRPGHLPRLLAQMHRLHGAAQRALPGDTRLRRRWGCAASARAGPDSALAETGIGFAAQWPATAARAAPTPPRRPVPLPLSACPASSPRSPPMYPLVQSIVALIAGILILVRPSILNYVVAIYLILVGVLGLLGAGGIVV
jgi:hypothetical protein